MPLNSSESAFPNGISRLISRYTGKAVVSASVSPGESLRPRTSVTTNRYLFRALPKVARRILPKLLSAINCSRYVAWMLGSAVITGKEPSRIYHTIVEEYNLALEVLNSVWACVTLESYQRVGCRCQYCVSVNRCPFPIYYKNSEKKQFAIGSKKTAEFCCTIR